MGKNAFYVIWVRHCESCSNVARDVARALYVEPFCTGRGVAQSYAAGKKLAAFVNAYFSDGANVSFCASVLPRAVETARIISAAFVAHPNRLVPAGTEVRRLPHISERWLEDIELAPGSYDDETVGSANTTTALLSDENAARVNEFFDAADGGRPFGIRVSRGPAETARLVRANGGITRFAYTRDSHEKFIAECLGSGWLDARFVSVVVSHGWFIAEKVVGDADEFENAGGRRAAIRPPDNTAAFLVRYADGRSTVVELIAAPTDAEIAAAHRALPRGVKKFIASHPHGNCAY